MKIIEALKKIKDLTRKAEDLRGKIGIYCADMSHENPTYGSPEQQKEQVSGWLQAHSDILKEISKLRLAIQKTNVSVLVPIELGGVSVTKTIAEWIHRRRDLAGLDAAAWKALSDRKLPPSAELLATNGTKMEVQIRRYYDAAKRDKHVDMYMSEPSTIDATLEVINAVTDVIE